MTFSMVSSKPSFATSGSARLGNPPGGSPRCCDPRAIRSLAATTQVNSGADRRPRSWRQIVTVERLDIEPGL